MNFYFEVFEAGELEMKISGLIPKDSVNSELDLGNSNVIISEYVQSGQYEGVAQAAPLEGGVYIITIKFNGQIIGSERIIWLK